MNRKFKERFEMELIKAKDSLDKPRGKKTYEKVIERVGRAIGKYPSIAKYYVIEYERDKDKPQNMKDIRWRIAVPENVDKNCGVYFLRTNVRNIDEETTWVVNTIRYRLKTKGESCFWAEIVRRMSTQKAVTTEGTNVLGEKVQMRFAVNQQRWRKTYTTSWVTKKCLLEKSDFVVHSNAN